MGGLLVGAVDDAGVLSSYEEDENGLLVVAIQEHIEGAPRVHPDWEQEFIESFLPVIRGAFGQESGVVFLREGDLAGGDAGAGCAPIEPQLKLRFDFDFTEFNMIEA